MQSLNIGLSLPPFTPFPFPYPPFSLPFPPFSLPFLPSLQSHLLPISVKSSRVCIEVWMGVQMAKEV